MTTPISIAHDTANEDGNRNSYTALDEAVADLPQDAEVSETERAADTDCYDYSLIRDSIALPETAIRLICIIICNKHKIMALSRPKI